MQLGLRTLTASAYGLGVDVGTETLVALAKTSRVLREAVESVRS